MRILQLCKKFPFPLKDGESIAVNGLSRALAGLGAEVWLLAMNTRRHFFAQADTRPLGLAHYADVRAVEVDNRIRLVDAFLNLFSSQSYHVSRFISADFERALINLLQEREFDIIQLETLYLAPYIPAIRRYSSARIVMRAHNVEHEVWERVTRNTRQGPRRWYLQYLTGKLKRFELEKLGEYDFLAAITRRDLDHFQVMGYEGPCQAAPIGLDASGYVPDYEAFDRPISQAFIGSLDWAPNLEGLTWFLSQVWPSALKRRPGLELHVAGRNTPTWLMQKHYDGVTIHGEVPDAGAFINQHPLFIAPFLSGGGIRAKILEAMALGRVVISSSMGLEGIDATHKVNVLIADSKEDWLTILDEVHQNPEILRSIGEHARKLILEHFDSLSIGQRLLDAYRELVADTSTRIQAWS